MLIDTNILVRMLQPQHPHYVPADAAIESLRARGRRLYLVPQNLVELWAVMTRPIDANGLGMSVSDAHGELGRLERFFAVLPETPALYATWKQLVIAHQVTGKSVHDARLVAAMQVHGLGEILTFDTPGFARYPGITAVNPSQVPAS